MSLEHYQSSVDITGIREKTETSPSDDAVLVAAPGEIGLKFPERVRLVKLTLRNKQRDWVDIRFRYDPLPGTNFHWQLPSLSDAEYYIAEWAILASNDFLIRGSFSFSFGPDAIRPSVTLAEEQLAEDIRLGKLIPQEPEFPLEIILDEKEERYDPPFTIQLGC